MQCTLESGYLALFQNYSGVLSAVFLDFSSAVTITCPGPWPFLSFLKRIGSPEYTFFGFVPALHGPHVLFPFRVFSYLMQLSVRRNAATKAWLEIISAEHL